MQKKSADICCVNLIGPLNILTVETAITEIEKLMNTGHRQLIINIDGIEKVDNEIIACLYVLIATFKDAYQQVNIRCTKEETLALLTMGNHFREAWTDKTLNDVSEYPVLLGDRLLH